MKLIKEIIEVKPYRLSLLFNDGVVKRIDLENIFRENSVTDSSKYRELLNPEVFCSVKIHPVWDTIYWDNGLDFCPDYLYELGTVTGNL